VNAQYNLGLLYMGNEHIKPDYAKAKYWYEKAAVQGDIPSLNELGNFYSKGLGIKQDYQKAIKYYLDAANAGDSDAQTNLGTMF
ncbi:tetratricopeptide repeat protein, partial [Acinetobacter baumannii]|nr:tetratricopeptide repeat protein [Acinetobacter baumannii]